jgi:outer membrane protein TolC
MTKKLPPWVVAVAFAAGSSSAASAAPPRDDAEPAKSAAPVPPGEKGGSTPPSPQPQPQPEPAEPTEAEELAAAPEPVLTASDAEGVKRRLRLDDAITLAVRRHPELAAARQRTLAAKAGIGEARSGYLPRIDGSLQYLRASEIGNPNAFHSVSGLSRVPGSRRDGVGIEHSFNNYLAALIVQQAIWDFGRTQGAVGEAKARVKVAEMNEALVEQIVVFEVVRTFYQVRTARETVRIAEEALNNALGILELAEAGTDSGLRPQSEKARAEADVAAAEVALIRAKLAVEVQQARIANAIGVPDMEFEPADEKLPAPPPAPEMKASIDEALENRPELEAIDLQKDVLGQNLRRVKALQYPRIDALAGVNTRGQFLAPAGQDSYNAFNWNVGAVVSIPMFQGLAVRKRKQAIKAEMSALDQSKETIRQAVILDVKEALAAVRAADEAEKAALKGVEAAKVNLETAQERYAAGMGTLIELTDAQSTWVSARSQAVQATFERHLARAALGLATGNARPDTRAP